MSSAATTRPVRGSKSWRLTPRIRTARPLTSSSTPRTSTRLKPIRRSTRSATSPSGETSDTARPYSVGTSADHGVIPGTRAVSRARPTRPGRTSGSASRHRATSSGADRAPAALRLCRSMTPRRGGPGTVQSLGLPGGGGAWRKTAARGSATPSTAASTRQPAAGWSPGQPSPTSIDRVPVVPSASRPASIARSARYVGPVAYRYTDRVMPPCHHWSWSSMKEVSDHFTTVSRRSFAPGRRNAVTSNSAARCESLLRPTSWPLSSTIRTLSAAPTWSTTRRPVQAAGTSNVRS